MKWLFLIVAVLAVLPLSAWLRSHPRDVPKMWVLFGFLAFSHGPLHLYMAVVSWPDWPGYVKGIELSLVDLFALAFYFSLPRVRVALPFKLAMLFYFLTSVLSIAQADQLTPALFYPCQLLRLFGIYAAVAKASAMDDRVVPGILKGMAYALFLQTGIAFWQRFGQGVIQASGMFDHQNTLGLLSHFVMFPYFALLLSGGSVWLPGGATFAGSLLGILTTSRGTVALNAIACIVLFLTSILRRWTPRKTWIGVVGTVGLAILIPFALFSFQARFARDVSLDANYDERAALEMGASRILADHPMGVGTNQFVLIANTRGYYASAGVAWQSFGALVHNVYWLVAAETGYIGLVAFIVLLIQPLSLALRCGWRNYMDKRGELLFGIGVALLTVYLQSLFEWVFISFQIEYVFASFMGMVAGLALRLGYWQRTRISPEAAPGSWDAGSEAMTLPMREPYGVRSREGNG